MCVCSNRCYQGFIPCNEYRKNQEHNKKSLSFTSTYLSPSPIFSFSLFFSLPVSFHPEICPSFLSSYLCVSPLALRLKTHMTLCQILPLDLRGSCAFFLTLFPFYSSLRIRSNKHKHAVSHRAGAAYTHTVCLCVCRYKCMLTVLLIFSFILSPLLSCQEAVSLCIYKSLFLSAFPALHHSPSLSVSLSLIHPLFPLPFCL